MKYWLLTTAYEQDNETGSFAREHARIFAANGHDVLIIQGGEENADQVTNISGNINIHSFSLTGRECTRFLGHDAALSYEFANEVIKLLAGNTPDVIEVQGYLGVGYYLLIRKYAGEPLLKNIPVIVTAQTPSFIIHERDHAPVYRFPQYWTGEMEKFCFLAADGFIAPDRSLAQLLQHNMRDAFPEQVHYIPYPHAAAGEEKRYYSVKHKIITDLIQAYTTQKRFPVLRPQPQLPGTGEPTLHDGLTVAIPYYNMGEFIDECLDSVFASTYKNVKIIIVDDGSTDSLSISKLNEIERTHPDIVIVRQKNAGLSEARNSGLRIAATKHIIFLDPDDTIHPEYFQRCIQILENYENISFISCWLKYFGAENGTWPGQNPEVPYLLYHNTVHSGCLFRTKDILQTGGYDRSLVYGMEDYEMAIHMVSKGFHGFTIPEALYNYRIRKQSMARAFTDDKKLYLYLLISKKHKSLFDKYGAESVNILNANGPGYLHDNPTFASRFTVKAAAPESVSRSVREAIFYKYPRLHKTALIVRDLLKRGK